MKFPIENVWEKIQKFSKIFLAFFLLEIRSKILHGLFYIVCRLSMNFFRFFGNCFIGSQAIQIPNFGYKWHLIQNIACLVSKSLDLAKDVYGYISFGSYRSRNLTGSGCNGRHDTSGQVWYQNTCFMIKRNHFKF